MRSLLSAATLVLVCGFGSTGRADPIQWRIDQGGNDHFYDLIFPPGGITWSAARAAAGATTFQDEPGYLATVTTAAEDEFLRVTFQLPMREFGSYAWIGLTDEVVEGDFRWVTEEPFAFSNWLPGEPNDEFGEDYVQYFAGDPGGSIRWGWNDLPGDVSGIHDMGYIVEFSEPLATTPEPSTLTLFGPGILGLLGYSWRRRRRSSD